MWNRNISHKEYVPSSILALPWIKPSVLEGNSDIRKCGRWLDSQLFGIFHRAKNVCQLSRTGKGEKEKVLFNIHCKKVGEGGGDP